jgi:hypothetical protein
MAVFNQQSIINTIQDNRFPFGFITPNGLHLIIGICGISLPLILFAGVGFNLMESISAYYYTEMRWFFVGFFITLGWLLIAYRGFPGSYDDIASTFAGVCAISIAIFPSSPPGQPRNIVAWLHEIFIILFLLAMIFMAWFLFTLNFKEVWNRRIYKSVAIGMFACLIGIIFFGLLVTDYIIKSNVFWFETIAFNLFGIAWLTKALNSSILPNNQIDLIDLLNTHKKVIMISFILIIAVVHAFTGILSFTINQFPGMDLIFFILIVMAWIIYYSSTIQLKKKSINRYIDLRLDKEYFYLVRRLNRYLINYPIELYSLDSKDQITSIDEVENLFDQSIDQNFKYLKLNPIHNLIRKLNENMSFDQRNDLINSMKFINKKLISFKYSHVIQILSNFEFMLFLGLFGIDMKTFDLYKNSLWDENEKGCTPLIEYFCNPR